jgi:hypothetical protein
VSKIVLVHGIAQELKSADTLEREWIPDVAGGLRIAGHAELADRVNPAHSEADERIVTRMVFYGDLFRQPGREIQGRAGIDEVPDDALSEELAREWLMIAAHRARPEAQRRDARRALGVGGAMEPQGVRALARGAINGLVRLPYFGALGFALAEKLVGRALSQVRLYLTDDVIRTEVLARVHSVIDSDTRVLVGHSLGSVVAYEAAMGLEQDIPLLVTLGSPLGLHTVVYEHVQPQPPRYPPRVARWVNVSDIDDLVAADPDLRDGFPPGPDGFLIDNGAQPHAASSYLASREVGRAIGEALADV